MNERKDTLEVDPSTDFSGIPWKTALSYAAMSIVNHTLESAGASVEIRQSVNDRCDEWAIKIIGGLIRTGQPLPADPAPGAPADSPFVLYVVCPTNDARKAAENALDCIECGDCYIDLETSFAGYQELIHGNRRAVSAQPPASDLAARIAASSDLHARIMNLPSTFEAENAPYANTREAYLYGRRDARHEAAELAAVPSDTDTLKARVAELEGALERIESGEDSPVMPVDKVMWTRRVAQEALARPGAQPKEAR